MVYSVVQAGTPNICVEFADVTRAPGVNLAHVTQMLRAKFACDVCHDARTCRAQQGILLLDERYFDRCLL
jgi:hypothetical protein